MLSEKNNSSTYEVHVTVKVPEIQVDELRGLVESVPEWTFSRITGDPLLGESVFCYATTHTHDLARAVIKATAMSGLLSIASFVVLRRKVEAILLDERKINGEWEAV